MQIGRRIRELREEKGLGQAELARRAGLYTNTLYRFEKGLQTPGATMVEKLANAIGVEPGALFEEGPVGPPDPSAVPGKKEGPPAWATTSDMNTFSERVSGLSLDELKRLALDLVSGEPVLTRENLPLSREKRGARVANFARAMVVADEFLGRGVAPPPQFAIAYRRHLEALASPSTPDVEAQRPAPEIPEAG
jgi:transcriptional regulator with XRE-family HTH domain